MTVRTIHRLAHSALLFKGLAVAPYMAAAQSERPLEEGDRVRVYAPEVTGNTEWDGTVVRVGGGEIVLDRRRPIGGTREAVVIPTRTVEALQVHTRSRGGAVGRVALGAAMGGGAMLGGRLLYCSLREEFLCGLSAIATVPLAAIAGGLIGEATIPPDWTSITLPPDEGAHLTGLTVGPGPSGGMALGVRIRFRRVGAFATARSERMLGR